MIDLLADIVSKNGNLLLNFPLPNSGELDFEEMEMLEGITAWMAINSEGIYASRPWKIYGEGPSTKAKIETGNFNEDKQKDLPPRMFASLPKGGTLYAFVMGWPEKASRGEGTRPCESANAGEDSQRGIARLQRQDQLEAG